MKQLTILPFPPLATYLNNIFVITKNENYEASKFSFCHRVSYWIYTR